MYYKKGIYYINRGSKEGFLMNLYLELYAVIFKAHFRYKAVLKMLFNHLKSFCTVNL